MFQFRSQLVSLVAAGLMGLAASGHGQSYPMAGGSPDRIGKHDASQTAFNPGRAFLRWWDPKVATSRVVDNFELGAAFVPNASWLFPTGVEAVFAYQKNPTVFPLPPAYRLAVPVASRPDEFWTPAAGVAPEATWTFSGLSAGDEYVLSVNVPVGPTQVASGLLFGAQFQAYRIDGVVNPDGSNNPVYELIDTFLFGGGWVQLGDGGVSSNRLFTVKPATSQIRITLIGTNPVNQNGQVRDPRTDIAVYADAARITPADAATGQIVSQPVVGQLSRAGAAAPWRVASVRNEPTTFKVGTNLETFTVPVLTLFNASGINVDPGDASRLNLISSYPAIRPEFGGNTQASADNYSNEKQAWFNGIGNTLNPTYARQTIEVDDTNSNVFYGAGWAPGNVAGEIGGSVHLLPAGGPTSFARFAPNLPPDDYSIEIWVPSATTASIAEVQVREGATTSTLRLDITGNAGTWVKLQNAATNNLWKNSATAPLSVLIGPGTSFPSGSIPADRMRFIRKSDLSSKSSPIFKTINTDEGGGTVAMDQVIMALENGQLIGVEADSGESGTVPERFIRKVWEYPLLNGANPNLTALEDLNAELPTNFNTSSAAVAEVNVGGTLKSILYIGSNNGRVYAFDLSNCSDGTVKRLWTYPDDYPAASVQSTLGPIVGSIAFSETASGPVVLVPTLQGRLYALDAVGTGINKTTTVKWAFPAETSLPVGPIAMTPTVGFAENTNRKVVYFGTGTNALAGAVPTLFAVRLEDVDSNGEMDLLWQRTSNNGGAFIDFAQETPVFVQQSDLGFPLVGFNMLYSCNGLGRVNGWNALTGSLEWESNEIGVSSPGGLGFTYIRNASEVFPGSAMVMIPGTDGSITGLYARTDRGGPGPNFLRFGFQSTGTVSGYMPQPSFGSDISPIHSYMYGVDPRGNLLAFSYDPNLPDNGQSLTPGDPPRDVFPANQSSSAALSAIVGGARVNFILKQDYEDLITKATNGVLDEADVLAAENKVTRTAFEFGESVYVMVSNLPAPDFFAPQFEYQVALTLNAPGLSSNRQPLKILPMVASVPNSRSRVAVGQFAFIGVGQNALTPGPVSFLVQAFGFSGGQERGNRSVAPANFRPSDRIQIANPLAVVTQKGVGTYSVGQSLSPSDPQNVGNGTPVADLPKLFGEFKPDLAGNSTLLSHGTSGVNQVQVFDRSLMTLLYGPLRGIQGVRMALGDLSFLGNVISPLNTAIYPNLEDLPGSIGNNRSLDYPDMRRERMTVVKDEFGLVENPLFQAVGLLPPTYLVTDQALYNTSAASYNAGLTRTLIASVFEFGLDVPRFQPPSTSGYAGNQFVYVDSGGAGRQVFPNQAPTEPYRSFELRANMGVDRRPVVTTPTVDLGSIPGGGGYNLSGSFPWTAAVDYRDSVLNGQAAPFFQRFTVENQGNVNLQNIRIAKDIERSTLPANQFSIVSLVSPGLHSQVGFDTRFSLHADVDPAQAGAFYNAFYPAAGNQVIIQKARPDDGTPTRLRMNPKRRANANLGVVDADLIPQGSFPNTTAYQDSIGDPRVAVSVPIGVPSGEYLTNLIAFEDIINPLANGPRLDYDHAGTGGGYEPYSDVLTLRFKVRETRLTTARTNKASQMVDTDASSLDKLTWSNTSPAVVRAPSGNVIVAFSSDRATGGTGGAGGFGANPKTEALSAQSSQWGIYFSVLGRSGAIGTGNIGSTPDLYAWAPSVTAGATGSRRWFNNVLGSFPTSVTPAATLFGGTAPIVAGSVQFGNPSFPSAGFANPLSTFTNANGKADNGAMYMAFTGECLVDTGRERMRQSRLFIAPVQDGNNGSVNVGTPVPVELGGNLADSNSVFGKPSLVQVGSNATVFWTSSSGGNPQILMSIFDGTNWIAPLRQGRFAGLVYRINTGSGFETVGSPSATLRDANPALYGGAQSVIELAFTGRLRGRTQSEAYIARIPTRGAIPTIADTVPFSSGGNALFERLVNDPATGLFWARGASWNQTLTGVNAIDLVQRTVVSGAVQFTSILDRTTLKQSDGSPILSYETILGGKAVIDTSTGSVRLNGVAIAKNSSLYVRYQPRFLRISDSTRANYRSVQVSFDGRPSADRTLSFDSGGFALTSGSNLSDRLIVTYARTSSNDSQITRPYMKTYRYGVELPNSIFANADGTGVNLTIAGGVSGGYQVDPANGRIFVEASQEGQTLSVTYLAVDDAGGTFNRTYTGPVRLIEETPEAEIPIEQAANESAPAIALDGITGNYGPNMATRPSLLWMFWTSTRSGGSDIFFQTLAPRFTATRR